MSTVNQKCSRTGLRRATLCLGLLVGAFVPLMQVLMDQSRPQVTKPAAAGIVVGMFIAGLALLPRRWNLRLFIVSVTGVITLGAAELICTALLTLNSKSIYMWDEATIYRPQPNTRKMYRRMPVNGGQIFEVKINSEGFRGPENPSIPDAPTVMVYGDSFIEAEYSAWESTFPEQLRRAAMSLTKHPLNVINAGVNGYGPDQVLRKMEQELPRIRPQLVVLSIFADNDYGDLLRDKIFRLNDRGELIDNAWSRSAECQHPGMRGPYEPMLWKLARGAVRHVQSAGPGIESYMKRWLVECQEEFEGYVTRGDSQVTNLQHDHYDADISLTPGTVSGSYKVRLFAKVLEQIATTCRKNGSQLLVMVIPSPADLIENYDYCGIDRQLYPRYEPRALTRLATSAAGKLQLPCIDLFEPFTRHQPASLYFRGGDNHWNDAGQQLAAKLVMPRVVELLRPH